MSHRFLQICLRPKRLLRPCRRKLSQEIATLEATVSRLARFETVANADDEAARLIREARIEVDRLLAEAAAAKASSEIAAAQIRRDAEADATSVRQDARQRAAKATADATALVADANARASQIIDAANRKAEDITGDALKALREANELERTIQALENRIEGYGDRYIVPTHSVLDDLAEAYGHVEVGQKLKASASASAMPFARGRLPRVTTSRTTDG